MISNFYLISNYYFVYSLSLRPHISFVKIINCTSPVPKVVSRLTPHHSGSVEPQCIIFVANYVKGNEGTEVRVTGSVNKSLWRRQLDYTELALAVLQLLVITAKWDFDSDSCVGWSSLEWAEDIWTELCRTSSLLIIYFFFFYFSLLLFSSSIDESWRKHFKEHPSSTPNEKFNGVQQSLTYCKRMYIYIFIMILADLYEKKLLCSYVLYC